MKEIKYRLILESDQTESLFRTMNDCEITFTNNYMEAGIFSGQEALELATSIVEALYVGMHVKALILKPHELAVLDMAEL